MNPTLQELLAHIYQQDQTIKALSTELKRLTEENARLMAEVEKQADESTTPSE
jgi:cell division protein FtsB